MNDLVSLTNPLPVPWHHGASSEQPQMKWLTGYKEC